MTVRAVEPWTVEPVRRFIAESQARLVLVMTPAGQVLAQSGFTRAVDVMSASALAAGIVASTDELAALLRQARFGALSHQGALHGIHLMRCDTPRTPLLVLSVFGRNTSLGLVQLFAEQLAVELGESAPTEARPRLALAEDFERELHQSLNALFGT
jgi:hypothetical protein